MPETVYYSDIIVSGNRVRQAAGSAAGTDYVTKDEMDAAIGAVGVQKFAMSIGDGVATSFVVNHELNTRDVEVQIYDNTSWMTVNAPVERTDVDNVTVDFNGFAPGPDGFRVVVLG